MIKTRNPFIVTDKFFALWINRIYNEKTELNSVFY